MALAVPACGEPAGPAPAEGEYSFAASYGANGYTCTLAGAILRLDLDVRGWTGWLSGGQIGCAGGIPGETAVPAPPDAALDRIVVRGDSVSFRLEGAEFVARGTLAGGNLAGTLEVARPFCQCTDSVLTGTWTASRVQPSSAKAMALASRKAIFLRHRRATAVAFLTGSGLFPLFGTGRYLLVST